jgi:co-chaperonin GroES (HSP10)
MATLKGKLRVLRDKVMVSDMYFGEQKTSSGIILKNDDGKVEGIYPRWGRVWAVGPEHKEEFQVGDWILVEHGRWTRGIEYEHDSGEIETIRLVENKAIIMWSNEKPQDVININKGIDVPQAVDAYRLENK